MNQIQLTAFVKKAKDLWYESDVYQDHQALFESVVEGLSDEGKNDGREAEKFIESRLAKYDYITVRRKDSKPLIDVWGLKYVQRRKGNFYWHLCLIQVKSTEKEDGNPEKLTPEAIQLMHNFARWLKDVVIPQYKIFPTPFIISTGLADVWVAPFKTQMRVTDYRGKYLNKINSEVTELPDAIRRIKNVHNFSHPNSAEALAHYKYKLKYK